MEAVEATIKTAQFYDGQVKYHLSVLILLRRDVRFDRRHRRGSTPQFCLGILRGQQNASLIRVRVDAWFDITVARHNNRPLGDRRLLRKDLLCHGHTYAGHPTAVAAGVSTVGIHRGKPLCNEVGGCLGDSDDEFADRNLCGGDTRSIGLFRGT